MNGVSFSLISTSDSAVQIPLEVPVVHPVSYCTLQEDAIETSEHR